MKFVVDSNVITEAISKVTKAVSCEVIAMKIGKQCWVGAENDKCKIKVFFQPSSISGEGEFGLPSFVAGALKHDGDIEFSYASKKLKMKAVKGRYQGTLNISTFLNVDALPKKAKEGAKDYISKETAKLLFSTLGTLPLAPATDEVKSLTTHVNITPGKLQLYLGDSFVIGYAEAKSKKIKETLGLTIPKAYESLISDLLSEEEGLNIAVLESSIAIWGKSVQLQLPISLPQLENEMITGLRKAHNTVKPSVDIEFPDISEFSTIFAKLNSVASARGIVTLTADKRLSILIDDKEFGYGELTDTLENKVKGKCSLKVNSFTLSVGLACIKKAGRMQMYDTKQGKTLRFTSGKDDIVTEIYCATTA